MTPAALAGLCGCSILYLLIPWPPFGWGASACLLLFLIVGQERFGLRERYLIVLAMLSAGLALWNLPEPWPMLNQALSRAAYLGAFLIMLSLLRDAASTSDSVLAVGRHLTKQPPGRRYWAIALGGHAMGVIMNFGALSLLAPLVQRGAQAGSEGLSPEIRAIRERRQLAALGRGFAWFVVWAPTAISLLVATTVVQGADIARVAPWGAVAAALVIALGSLEDKALGGRVRRAMAKAGEAPPDLDHEPAPRRELKRLALVYLILIVAIVGFSQTLGFSLVNGVMLATAPVTVGWIAAQNLAGRGDGSPLAARIRGVVTRTMPQGSPEAATLALAGFIGAVLAATIPPERVAALVDLSGGAPLWLYLVVLGLVPLASTLALPPILTVTFLGSALSVAGAGAIRPDLLALALICGWAINLTGSPFGAANLILSRLVGVPVTVLAYRWHGVFNLGAYGVCAGLLTILFLGGG